MHGANTATGAQRQRTTGCTLAAGSWASHTSEAELLQAYSLFNCLYCFVSTLFWEPARGSSVCNCLLSPEVTLHSLIPAELCHPLRSHHTQVLILLVRLSTITHLILSGCKKLCEECCSEKNCPSCSLLQSSIIWLQWPDGIFVYTRLLQGSFEGCPFSPPGILCTQYIHMLVWVTGGATQREHQRLC